MGYKRPVLMLTFDGEEFDGLEVRAKRLSVAELLGLASMADELGRVMSGEGSVEDKLSSLKPLYSALDNAIAFWNLEEDVQAEDGSVSTERVPKTPEGIGRQDFAFLLALTNGIIDSIAGVATPLPKPSGSGSQSLERSLPMEAL